jgi:CBS domain-containing protein
MISELLLKNAERHLGAEVKSYMAPVDRLLIREEASFGEALGRFSNPIDVLFVVDDESSRKLKGILTRSDAKAAQLRDVKLNDKVMTAATKRVILLRETNTIDEAVRVFSGNNPLGIAVDFIPICSPSNEVIGYLSAADLLQKIVQSNPANA